MGWGSLSLSAIGLDDLCSREGLASSLDVLIDRLAAGIGGVAQVGMVAVGVAPMGVVPVGVVPGGVTSGGVTPGDMVSVGVAPMGVASGGVTSGGMTSGGVASGSMAPPLRLCRATGTGLCPSILPVLFLLIGAGAWTS